MELYFHTETLGNYKVMWFPLAGGKRVYISNSVPAKVREREDLPERGRIDQMGTSNNYRLWVSPNDEYNFYLHCVDGGIVGGTNIAPKEFQLQDCGKFDLPKSDAIIYYQNENLPVVFTERVYTIRGFETEYIFYGKGVLMRVPRQILNDVLNTTGDILWTTKCNLYGIESEGCYVFRFYSLPVRDGEIERKLYISNLYPPDMKELPSVAVIRELEGGDYVLYPFEGREKYNFSYKYIQSHDTGLPSLLDDIQLSGYESKMVTLEGRLHGGLFISSPSPFVVIRNYYYSDHKYILFKGETLGFSTDVFNLISEHQSILDECSNMTFDAVIHHSDILLPADQVK